jgi:hypothetical protein
MAVQCPSTKTLYSSQTFFEFSPNFTDARKIEQSFGKQRFLEINAFHAIKMHLTTGLINGPNNEL